MSLIGFVLLTLLGIITVDRFIAVIQERVMQVRRLETLYWYVHALEREVEAQTLKGYFRPCTCGGCRRTRARLGLAQLR